MKQVSQKFKDALKQYGRQIDVTITYTENGTEKLLDTDTLFAVTPITNGNLLKSVMKQLNFESSVKVPKDTIINLKFGVLIDYGLTVAEINEMKVNRLNSLEVKNLASLPGFEYIDFGNYIVAEEPEYNADTLSYSYKCFDKMIYSMKDYENLGVPYPITIKNYLTALATKIGLQLKESTFYNQNENILNELYLDTDGNSLGYTYRDVLDEIAQATGSIICISNDDKLEVRYLNETNETINADYLKDINVEFKEQYGSINTVVLSRSAGADNIYYPDPLPQNPISIKIADNQIMNFDNRDDFIEGIYNAVNGTNYYINDFKSTGICYLELGDKYNIVIDDVTYNCVLLNDEIDITQGIEEQIYTEMPEQAETDYTKADKTDRKINQTTLIVDKQNQRIEGIISQIGDRSQKTTTITADIDGIESRVEDIEDLTNEVNGVKTITLENCVEGSLLELHIYGNNTVFDYLYPQDDLYPANDLYPYGDSRIVVTDENDNSVIYELGITDVLRQNGNVKDEYVLQNNHAKVIRRINSDGTVKANEVIEDLGEFSIGISEGTNTITIQNYIAQIKAKFAIQSDFTDVFATKVEMNSSITQTAEEINLEVRKKVDENEVISKINQSAEQISIQADKISLSGKTLNLADNMAIRSNNFNVDSNGNMRCNNANVSGSVTATNGKIGNFTIRNDGSLYLFGSGTAIDVTDGSVNTQINANGIVVNTFGGQSLLNLQGFSGNAVLNMLGAGDSNISAHTMYAYTYSNLSTEDLKKNIQLFEQNALSIIQKSNIYEFNYKTEKNDKKRHIGFIIGENYKTPKEVLSNGKDGIDMYSMASILWKAVQEQQKQIEQLQAKIKEMEAKNE